MKKFVQDQSHQHTLLLNGQPLVLGTNTVCQAFGGAKVKRHIIGGDPVKGTVITSEQGEVPMSFITGLSWAYGFRL